LQNTTGLWLSKVKGNAKSSKERMREVEGSPIMTVFATVTKGMQEECEGRSIMV